QLLIVRAASLSAVSQTPCGSAARAVVGIAASTKIPIDSAAPTLLPRVRLTGVHMLASKQGHTLLTAALPSYPVGRVLDNRFTDENQREPLAVVGSHRPTLGLAVARIHDFPPGDADAYGSASRLPPARGAAANSGLDGQPIGFRFGNARRPARCRGWPWRLDAHCRASASLPPARKCIAIASTKPTAWEPWRAMIEEGSGGSQLNG